MATQRSSIIAHHLIWTLYGHWLPNDPRGSGSEGLCAEKLEPLGPVHFGRLPAKLQPTREELQAFYRQAKPLLDFPTFWIDDAKRQAIGNVFGKVIAKQNYTVWACAILSNHAHIVIRKHRDDALRMWHAFADDSRLALRELDDIGTGHPVWSTRPYKVFLRTPGEVWTRINYVTGNPEKEGLPRQNFEFIEAYNNWPFHKTSSSRSH